MRPARQQGRMAYFASTTEDEAPIPLVVQIACVIAVLATVVVILAVT